MGKDNKFDSNIYIIKEIGLDSAKIRRMENSRTLNGVNPNIFKEEEFSEADKMRMTDNLHDK